MNNDEILINDEEKEDFLIKEFDNINYNINIEFDEGNIEIIFECLDDIKEYKNKFTLNELQNAKNYFKIFDKTEKLVSVLKKLIMKNSSKIEFEDENMILILKSEELEEEIKFLLKIVDWDINDYLKDFKKKINKNFSLFKSLNKKFKENDSLCNKLVKENTNLKHNNFLLNEKVKDLENKIKLLESKITLNSSSNISEKSIENISTKSDNFSLKVLKLKNTYYIKNNVIFCIKLLQDGRLALTAEDYKIEILNLETFKPDLILKEHVSNVNCIEQLSDGTLVSCSNDESIILYKLIDKNSYLVIQTLFNHNDCVLKVRELKNKNLASCSYDYTIKIWKKEKEKFEEIYSFKNTNYVLNFYEIKENILISDCWNYSLNFWDLNLNKKIKTVNNIILNGGYLSSGFLSDSFCDLNESILLYGGYGYIYLINRFDFKINTIIVSNLYNLCFCRISDYIFLNGNNEGNFIQWKNIENYNLLKIDIKETHDKTNIRYIIKNDNYIISCDDKGNIKFWNYNN